MATAAFGAGVEMQHVLPGEVIDRRNAGFSALGLGRQESERILITDEQRTDRGDNMCWPCTRELLQ